jgi:hypothetical protein
MKALLIVLVILLVLFLLIHPFLSALIKDKQELADTTLAKKFPFFFDTINNGLFDGKGEIIEFEDNPRIVNMMSTDPMCQNMIVHFLYSTGHMTIELGYKYFRQELIFKHTAYGLGEGSTFKQRDLANAFVEEAQRKIKEHQQNVTRLQSPEQIVEHVVNDPKFYDDDPISMIENSYGDITKVQKESIICVGYLIATANGESEATFTQNPTVLTQLRYFNVAWADCRYRLNSEGEQTILSHLEGLGDGTLAMIEPFLSSMVLYTNTNLPDEQRHMKLMECMEAIGVSQEKYMEIATKNRLIMQMFSDGK